MVKTLSVARPGSIAFLLGSFGVLLPGLLWANLPENHLELGLSPNQISFLVQGDETSPETVLFLHGVGSRKETWNSVVRALGPIGRSRRLVSMDSRGHGQTPLNGVDQRPWLHAVDLKNWMDAHGLPAAHFVGHSLGGRVALAFAALFPERVKSLVVVDIAPFKSRRDEASAERIRAGTLAMEFADDMIAQSWGEDLTGAIPSAPFPILFMSGNTELGAILTPKHQSRLLELNPQLQFSHFQNAGHGLYKEQCERFVAELEAFWGPLPQTRPVPWYLRCSRWFIGR